MAEKFYVVLYELSRLIFRFTLINLLWIAVNLPVFIILIQIALTTEATNLFVLLPLLSLLLPVFFFPGTHALIDSLRALIKEDASFNALSFFGYYKESFKKSFLIGMVFTSMLTVGGYMFFTIYQQFFILSIVLVVLFFYLSILIFYLLYLDAHYDMPFVWKIKQTTVFILKHPLFAFTNFILFLALHYILFSVSLILFVLFGTSLTVYATYYLFIRKLDKLNTRTS